MLNVISTIILSISFWEIFWEITIWLFSILFVAGLLYGLFNSPPSDDDHLGGCI